MYASGLVLPALQPAIVDNSDVDDALKLAPQDRLSSTTVVADSGGGAMGGFWLLALATAALTLRAVRPTPGRFSAASYRR